MPILRTLSRTITPLVAFGAGFALFPRDYRRGNLRERKLSHINESVLDQLKSNKEFQQLSSDTNTIKYHSSDVFPHQHRKNYVGSGLLFGPDLFEIDPVIFLNEQQGTITGFYHLGKSMISQDGQIHNGVVSTILDEGLCSCGFPKLPSNKGVTAQLSIDFQNQAPPDSTVVLRGRVAEAKGRKVVIEGTLETFPLKQGEKPITIANSRCILVEPKWFKYLSWLQVF